MSDLEAMQFDASQSTGEVDWDSAEETVDFPEGISNEDNSSEDNDSDTKDTVEDRAADNEPSDEGSIEDSEDASIEDKEEASDEENDSDDSDGEGEEEKPSLVPEAMQAKGIIEQDGEYGKTVTVDGEEQFVTLEELGNDFSGQKALAKRFTEFDTARSEYNAEVKQVETYINEFASKMQSGDVVGAFQYFGQFANIAPYQIKESLLAALGPEVGRRGEMSAPELQAELLQEQNNYLTDLNESELSRREGEQTQRELDLSSNNLRETHDISVDEWTEASSYITAEANGQEVTPDVISEYVVNLRAYDKADEIVGSLEASDRVDDAFIDSFQKIIKDNPDFSDDDLKNLIKDSVLDDQDKSIGKQLKTRKEKSSPSKREMSKDAKMIESGQNEIDPELEDLF